MDDPYCKAQAWVTSVHDNASAAAAIVLARSLVRSLTIRRLVVFVSKTVGASEIELLKKHCDSVIKFDMRELVNDKDGVEEKYISPFICLRLPILKKCVYLSPFMVALENCDHIFDEYETGAEFVGDISKTLCIATFQPSDEKFEAAMNEVVNGQSASAYWKQYPCFKRHYVFGPTDIGRESCNPSFVYLDSRVGIPCFTEVENTDVFKSIQDYVEVLKSDIEARDVQPPLSCKTMPIAIIGMACRLPGASNKDELWKLLMDGKCTAGFAPEGRWPSELFKDIPAEMRNNIAGYLDDDIYSHDAKFFGMSPHELEFSDPQQRFLLRVALEAIQDAGISVESLKNSLTSIYTGIWLNTYHAFLNESFGRDHEYYRTYMGNSMGASAGKLSQFLGTIGPNIASESGCSSSMVAVGLGINSLRDHTSNLSIACGVNLFSCPILNEHLFPVSKNGKSKVFDANADGYGRAEGCAALIMKRLPDAVAHGDNIYGIIRGYGQAQEGTSKVMGTPTVHVEALAMKNALFDANVMPKQVSFVETHGTGTAVGDPIEILSIDKAYSNGREDKLIIGAVKGNVGHTESCSGIVGIIKTLLAMKFETIPPHIGCDVLNPKIEWERSCVKIPFEPIDWKRGGNPRIAGVSSFGITGTDTHLILQEPHQNFTDEIKQENVGGKYEILGISAKSEFALDSLLSEYDILLENPDTQFENLMYSANLSSSQYRPHRAAIIGMNSNEILRQLKEGNFQRKSGPNTKPKICFLFAGLGSQYPGMSKELYKKFPIFRKHFDKCSRLLKENQVEMSLDDIVNVGNCSPLLSAVGIFCVQYALTKLWKSWGIKPDVVLGHSFGELAAASTSKAISLKDAIMIAAKRTKFTQLNAGMMVAAKTNHARMEAIIQDVIRQDETAWVDYCCINSPMQIVVGGLQGTMQKVIAECTRLEIKTTVINPSLAMHSRLMDNIVQPMEQAMEGLHFQRHNCDYLSGITGELMPNIIDSKYIASCNSRTVKFEEACQTAYENGCRVFLEISPHPILSALLLENLEGLDPVVSIPSIKKKQCDEKTMLTAASLLHTAGIDMDWSGFYKHCRRKIVSVPTYPLEGRRYFITKKIGEHIPQIQSSHLYHPLLGNALPIAGDAAKVWENHIDLGSLSYLEDHKVGTATIFPAAGFIEMFLAAAFKMDQLQEGGNKVVLTDICIHNALGLGELGCDVQTVASESLGLVPVEMKIYRKNKKERDDNYKFKIHASCALAPSNFEASSGNEKTLPLMSELTTSWVEAVDEPESIYQKFQSHGLNFGDTFKMIKQIWRNGSSLVAKIEVPADSIQSGLPYSIHPIALDSMIQVSFLDDVEDWKTLKLPVSIESLRVFQSQFTDEEYFVCATNINHGRGKEVTLYSTNGTKIAIMSNVETVPSTVRAIEKLVMEAGINNKIPLYENVWEAVKVDIENAVPTPDELSVKRNWLIYDNSTELATNLSKQLARFDRSATVIKKRTIEDIQDFEGIVYLKGIEISDPELSQSEVIGDLLDIGSQLSSGSFQNVRIIIVTQGAVDIRDETPLHPVCSTLWGFCRTFRSEYKSAHVITVDIDGRNDITTQASYILSELWNSDTEFQTSFRDGQKFHLRLENIKPNIFPTAVIPQANQYYLELPKSKTIADLKFVAKIKQQSVSGSEVEVEVIANGLNFKDVLTVLQPGDGFKNGSLGMEFSGIVAGVGENVKKWKIGDSVIGYNFETTGMPSRRFVEESSLIKLPDGLTYEEGATLPIVFITVYHCLVNVAKLKAGETILIHTAAGGVGLCAVQFAQLIGARVIATAGSNRKRSHLRSVLGVKDVFDSRSLSYGDKIMEVTNGRGVDVVLNSLTGPGFKETTLLVSSKNARFVEMSRLNIWSNADVESQRPDVAYTVVDLSCAESSLLHQLFSALNDYMEEGKIKPITHTKFNASNICEAMEFLGKGRNIGKVVVVFPIRNRNNFTAIKYPLFNKRSTYLITGGLGGIGLALVEWMYNQGARSFILMGRSAPSDTAKTVISKLSDATIEVVQGDVGKMQDCRKICEVVSSKRLPPIRGIMHAAGSLSDAIIPNQTLEKFNHSFSTKVDGSYNLHKLSLTENWRLEHLVFFSSISALLGTPGQSNYAAANTYMDALAEFRHANGLAATSVNWGLWGDVGLATNVKIGGMEPFSSSQAFDSLEELLKSHKTQAAVVNMDFEHFKQTTPWITSYAKNIKAKASNRNLTRDYSKPAAIPSSLNFWTELKAQDFADGKMSIILNNVIKIVRHILRLQPEDDVDQERDLQEMGVDSLVMIDLKNALHNMISDKASLTMSDILECHNVKQIAHKLNSLLDV